MNYAEPEDLPALRLAEPRALAHSSLSISLGWVQVELLPVEVSLREEAELKGGMERLEGEGEGGLVAVLTSSLGSEWVRERGAPDMRLFGLYFGGSLKGTVESTGERNNQAKIHQDYYMFIIIIRMGSFNSIPKLLWAK